MTNPDEKHRPSAVVFAYHNIGVRAIKTLLARRYRISLIVTHEDDPSEGGWFASVETCARNYGIRIAKPAKDEIMELLEEIKQLRPEFIFSVYYRHMIPDNILRLASRGALNLHGSLLPHYRGRAPVNWAILRGESQTGASLHYMTAKPDAGDLVGQMAVPILPDDTAAEVMTKVTVAGELLLWELAPQLAAGTARRTPVDLAAGNYCGRRRPEDGRIDWRCGAREIHNLIRAVAPPYPGAFTNNDHGCLRLLRSTYRGEEARHARPTMYVEDGRVYVDCSDSERIELIESEISNHPITAVTFPIIFASASLHLE